MNGYTWRTAKHWVEVIWFPMILFMIGAAGGYFTYRIEYMRMVQIQRVETDQRHDKELQLISDRMNAQADRINRLERFVDLKVLESLERDSKNVKKLEK